MPTRKDDSAFPIFDSQGMVDSRKNYTSRGITKREYFAAMALQGILSNQSFDPDTYSPGDNATLAIEAADLLIYKLNNGKFF